MPGSNYGYSTGEAINSQTPLTTPSQPSNFTVPGYLKGLTTREFNLPKFSSNFNGSPSQQQTSVPEVYQTKTFDRDAKLKEMYGTNASKRDVRKFNKYWNSDQRWADQDAFEAAEHQKYTNSLDNRFAAIHNAVKTKSAASVQGIQDSLNKQPIQQSTSVQPKVNPVTDWNAIAASKLGNGKTMNDVKILQEQLAKQGFDVGNIDGMWGDRTQRAYEQSLSDPFLNKRPVGTRIKKVDGQEVSVKPGKVTSFSDFSHPSGINQNDLVQSNTRLQKKEKPSQNWFTRWVLNAAMADAPAVATASGWRINEQGDVVQDQQDNPDVTQLRDNLAVIAGTAQGITGIGRAAAKTGTQKLLTSNVVQPKALPGPMNTLYDKFGNVIITYNIGGQINKHQQGGTMQNEQELQKAFMAYLIEDAAAQGMQIQSEQDLQAYAQQLGEEGLKAKYQEFMQKMQGGVKAALGAKLNYINKLKGNCPEGEELVYMKQGGRMCPVCQKKAEKAENGKKLKKKNAVSDFKEKRKQINPNDTVNTKFGPRDLNGKTKYPKYNAKKENYNFETRMRVQEKDEKSGKKVIGSACGSKMKKK